MELASTRIITADVGRLVAFYEAVTGLTATRYTDDFAELRTSGATLAIGSTRTLALDRPSQAHPRRTIHPETTSSTARLTLHSSIPRQLLKT